MNLDPLRWRKSSYSGQTGGDCVEFAQPAADSIWIRDSKRTDGSHLAFTARSWASFIGRGTTPRAAASSRQRRSQ